MKTRLEKIKHHYPLLGWLAIGAVVVGYDDWALKHGKITLSKYFAEHPSEAATIQRRKNWNRINNVLWICLSWHLMHGNRYLLPTRLQPTYRKYHPLWRLHDTVALKPIVVYDVARESFSLGDIEA
jgi:hypothetical protein